MLRILRNFVPNLKSNENGYKDEEYIVSFFLYQNFGAFSIIAP